MYKNRNLVSEGSGSQAGLTCYVSMSLESSHPPLKSLSESVGVRSTEFSLEIAPATSEWNDDLAERKKPLSRMLSTDLVSSASALAMAINSSKASASFWS